MRGGGKVVVDESNEEDKEVVKLERIDCYSELIEHDV